MPSLLVETAAEGVMLTLWPKLWPNRTVADRTRPVERPAATDRLQQLALVHEPAHGLGHGIWMRVADGLDPAAVAHVNSAFLPFVPAEAIGCGRHALG